MGPGDGLPGYAHLFKSIFECSAAGMLVLDANGQCVSVNEAFCDLIGYTAEEILANSMPEITHPDDLWDIRSTNFKIATAWRWCTLTICPSFTRQPKKWSGREPTGSAWKCATVTRTAIGVTWRLVAAPCGTVAATWNASS
jgi:PAS domain-containing protein